MSNLVIPPKQQIGEWTSLAEWFNDVLAHRKIIKVTRIAVNVLRFDLDGNEYQDFIIPEPIQWRI